MAPELIKWAVAYVLILTVFDLFHPTVWNRYCKGRGGGDRVVVLVSSPCFAKTKLIRTLIGLRRVHCGRIVLLSSERGAYGMRDDCSEHLSDIVRDYGVEVVVRPQLPRLDEYVALVRRLFPHGGLSDGRELGKLFQWHKLWLFDASLGLRGRVMYMDAGMTVGRSLDPLWRLHLGGSFVAHSDAYDEMAWRLQSQFHFFNYSVYARAGELVDLNGDYFQSGFMLFDAHLVVTNRTFDTLIQLMHEFPFHRTNEQSLLNLFFNQRANRLWKALHSFPEYCNPLCFYDSKWRFPQKSYILWKN